MARRKAFDEWKREVDEIVSTTTGGLRTDDLPDVDYAALHDAGESPSEAARVALDEAGWTPADGVV